MSESVPDSSGVLFPPPLIFAICLFLGMIVNTFYPMPFLPSGWTMNLGAPLMMGGFALGVWALATMRRAQTSPDPGKPTRILLTSGPFAFSRNPIYVSFALTYLGMALAFNSLLTLILLPLALIVLQIFVIAREEKYLAHKFGDTYKEYQARVRRWF